MEPKSKLNQKFLKKIQNNESDEDDDVNDNNDNVIDIFFRNEDCVGEFFDQMNAISALHPDIDSDDEGDYDDYEMVVIVIIVMYLNDDLNDDAY
jgi:hypothetical protein